MPNIIDNTAAQNAITSTDGANKVPKLDARSYFFLENGDFTLQTAAQHFGVINDNEFRTTSIVSVTGKKIISICRGQIFIQPMTGDTTKVNLILKPYTQPINGISIKYFIYRGLLKSNFIDASGNVVASGNGLITHIRNEFNSFYQQDASNPNPPPFLAKYIGYPDAADTTQSETDLIDSYFYKISQSYDGDTENLVDPDKNFEFPLIPAGTQLATETSAVGLDIVLNYGDYFIANDLNPFKFDLAFARAASNVINVSAIADDFQKKQMRETITQFLDPAAYYGLHANGGKIYRFGQPQAIESAQDIAALIDKFATKNKIYVYIQSNRQRSYNFYNNYNASDSNANNIKIGTAEANLAETTFETDHWPVKVFTSPPAAGSDKQTIALQFTTDKTTNVCLYGDIANIGSANSGNFADAKDLLPLAGTPAAATPFTTTVLLYSPIANNLNVASIIKLIYIGKDIILSKPAIDDGDPDTPLPDPLPFTARYMDDVFDLVNGVSFLQADKIYHVHSYKPVLYNQQELDKNRKRVVAFTQRTQNTIAVSDTENLTLFTYLAIAENEQSSHSNAAPNASPNKEATGYAVQNVAQLNTLPNLPSSENVQLKIFTDSGTAITAIELKTFDGSKPTSMALGITEAQHDQLKALIGTSVNAKIFFENYNDGADKILSPETYQYAKYSLAATIEDATGAVKVVRTSVPDSIVVYSLDGLVFFSPEYSAQIVSMKTVVSILKMEV